MEAKKRALRFAIKLTKLMQTAQTGEHGNMFMIKNKGTARSVPNFSTQRHENVSYKARRMPRANGSEQKT